MKDDIVLAQQLSEDESIIFLLYIILIYYILKIYNILGCN